MDTASKVAAGGFTLVASVLAFLGVSSGSVEAMVRAYPRWSLFMLCIVSVAVLVGAISPVLPTAAVAVGPFLLGGVIAGAAVLVVVPDLAGDGSGDLTSSEATFLVVLVAAAGVLAVRYLWGLTLPFQTLALCLAVGALGVGLYGAAKLVVKATADPRDVRTTSAVEGTGEGRTLQVAIKVGRLDKDARLRAVLEIESLEGATQRSAYSMLPDEAGVIDETIKYPLGAAGIKTVRVCVNTPSGAAKEVDLTKLTCDDKAMTIRSVLSLRDVSTTTTTTAKPASGQAIGISSLPVTP